VAIAAPVVVFGGTELGLRLAGFEFALRELPIHVWNAAQDGQRRVSLADYGRALVEPWSSPGRALIELEAELEADGARLILCCMPRSPDVEQGRPVLTHYNIQQRNFARSRDLQHLDMRAALREEIAAGADPLDWFLEGKRIHPNAYGQRRLAEELLPLVLDAQVGRPGPRAGESADEH
jgi:hypothetical protein